MEFLVKIVMMVPYFTYKKVLEPCVCFLFYTYMAQWYEALIQRLPLTEKVFKTLLGFTSPWL